MMKKLFALCLLLLAFSLFACSPTQENADSGLTQSAGGEILEFGIITDAEVVNIRQSASMEGRILDTARRGEFFLVEDSGLADDEGNLWVKIRYRGESAFVHSEYIFQMVWEENTTLNMGEVLERDVYVYSEPSTDSEILYRTYKGEPLILYAAEDADWYRIFYSRGEAYIPAGQIAVRSVDVNALLN